MADTIFWICVIALALLAIGWAIWDGTKTPRRRDDGRGY